MKIRFMFSYTYVHTFKTIDLTRWVVVWSSNEEQYRQAELNRNRNHLKNSRSLTYDVYLHNMTDGNILMISLSAQVTTAMSDVIHQMKYNREIRKDGWTWRTFTYNFVYIYKHMIIFDFGRKESRQTFFPLLMMMMITMILSLRSNSNWISHCGEEFASSYHIISIYT